MLACFGHVDWEHPADPHGCGVCGGLFNHSLSLRSDGNTVAWLLFF